MKCPECGVELTGVRPERVSPLVRAVCEALQGGPLTVAQLVARTGLPIRSVRHVIYGHSRDLFDRTATKPIKVSLRGK